MAQDNALTGAALDEIRAATGDSALGPSAGSVTDYGITHVPVAGTINDIADGVGISAGDGIDWLLGRLGGRAQPGRLRHAERCREDRSDPQYELRITGGLGGPCPVRLRPGGPERRQGQPFVDGNGALKPHMSPDEAQAFREWAAPLAIDPGLTFADAD